MDKITIRTRADYQQYYINTSITHPTKDLTIDHLHFGKRDVLIKETNTSLFDEKGFITVKLSLLNASEEERQEQINR